MPPAQAPFQPGGIAPGLSAYFDLVRFGAAAVVFLDHLCPVLFGTPTSLFPGHDAVIVFFVLSGYVVAMVVDRRETSPTAFATARLARLWSVMVPALLLGLALDVGMKGELELAAVVASLLNLAFLAQLWLLDIAPPHNPPMWSLSYEAWYYLVLGLWQFGRGHRWWLAAGAVCLAGPKIVVLLPVWTLGVLLYRWRPRLEPRLAAALLALSVLLYVGAYVIDLPNQARTFLSAVTSGRSWRLGASTAFLADYLLGLVIALNFIAVDNLPRLGRLLAAMRPFCAGLASCTLSLYLFHKPLLTLLHEGLGIGPVATFLAIIALIPLLALATEHQRHLWRNALASPLRRLMPIPR
ncbi:hypothetical protein JYK14_05740 [Siccirubricoccus sp. KC 17139]|uniref:Acyltransferase 3 domain-containing protein n=1 Tax=Siccirubricoccus soli TaxID=2899147 RepID=A0ABT1D3Y0_9PROT|nr:acyltransferase family protein [Siccirubricoccus soli]MCO6415680.1 hypothetical protein [Siccirubricoccus soli]MCP2681812.1 hypothetical protein [Siccirubricoccus soli]